MSDRYRIDSHKMALHPARTAAWLAAQDNWELAREIFPIYMEISPVGYCNHQCTFCGVDYMLDRTDRPQLHTPTLIALLDDMAAHGVKSAMFAGAGEPLLHRGLADALVHCDAIGLDTSITTNGVAMREPFLRRALTARTLRWIKVSCNGGDRDTYARIHRTNAADFDRVVANLETAVNVRAELGSACTLGAQMVALPGEADGVPGNLDSALTLARRLRDTGIDYLVIKPYSQHLMSTDSRVYDGTTYPGARQWAEALAAESTDTYRVLVRTQTMAHLDDADRGYHTCHATPYHWAYVEADGNVWGCSAYLGREEAGKRYGDDRFRYGNLHEAPFSEIWRGERRHANWTYVRESLDISQCRLNCRMHQVNLYLQEVAHPGPHDNFI